MYVQHPWNGSYTYYGYVCGQEYYTNNTYVTLYFLSRKVLARAHAVNWSIVPDVGNSWLLNRRLMRRTAREQRWKWILWDISKQTFSSVCLFFYDITRKTYSLDLSAILKSANVPVSHIDITNNNHSYVVWTENVRVCARVIGTSEWKRARALNNREEKGEELCDEK